MIFLSSFQKENKIYKTLYIDNYEEFVLEKSEDFEKLYTYDIRIDNLNKNYTGKFIIRVLNMGKITFDVIDSENKIIGNEISVEDEKFYKIPFKVQNTTENIILRYKTLETDLSIFKIDIEFP